jgi:hypothetical protein
VLPLRRLHTLFWRGLRAAIASGNRAEDPGVVAVSGPIQC